MLNSEFLKHYILKNQKYTQYLYEQLDHHTVEELREIIYIQMVINKF